MATFDVTTTAAREPTLYRRLGLLTRKDTHCVRHEPCKVLIYSGCNSHPATG